MLHQPSTYAFAQQVKEDYERRLRVLERTLHGEKERRRQLGFQNKQLETRLKKIQNDNTGLEKQLKSMKKCASCSHLDQRSKSYNALNELLHGSIPALEPENVASTSAARKNDEMKIVKIANNDLQQCVDKLQSMLREKGREAAAAEKYYTEAVSERERQIAQLQKELEIRSRGMSTQSAVGNQAEAKLKALLKERTELLNRIQRLENENRENGSGGNELQSPTTPANTAAVLDDDVNPYCGYCREKVKNWNKMLSRREMDYADFVNKESDNSNRFVQEIAVLEKKIQKLSLALETEKARSKAVENALKDENDTLSANYQKLLRQYDSLEIELGKRRNTERNAKEKEKQNGSAVPIVDTRLVSQLKSDLEKANTRIISLEGDLIRAKQTIYQDSEFVSTQLRRQIEELEKRNSESARILEYQKARLLQLDDEVAALTNEKRMLQRKYTALQRSNNLAVQEKLEQLEIIETLRKELSALEETQNDAAKTYNAQIEAYQQLIKQKDDERGALIAELCAANRPEIPLHNSIGEIQNRHEEANENRELLKELRELNHEKQALSEKLKELEKELESVKDQLRCKSEEVEKEVILKNSMHDDLAKVRTMLLEKEAEVLNLNNQLKIAEVNVMKLETELANATDRLQIEQSTAETLKVTVEELEDMLGKKSSELITAAQERQRCTGEMQKMKEFKYDLETKLTLQGRELKDAREKLAALRKKIRELEREASSNSAEKSVPGTATRESTKSTLATAFTKSSSDISH